MSFIINQGFSLKSPQFNFERDYFKDVASLKAANESDFPDFFITNVGGVLYQLNKSNSVNETLGRWRKLITTGSANAPVYDSVLSTTSANAVQNKVVSAAINNRASKDVATTSTNGLLSSTDKAKLDGIASGANKTVVDTTLSSTSTNPVQNKVIASNISQLDADINNLEDVVNSKADKTVASQTANGLLSAADKKKLDGIATGGTADSAITNEYIDTLFN